MANILYLVHRLPYPPNKGDKVRSYHLLKYLAARHRIFLGTFIDDPEDESHVNTLLPLCADMHVERIALRSARLRSLAGLLHGEALTLPYYRSAALSAWVEWTIREQRPDAAVVFSSAMAQYIPADSGLRTFVDLVDVDSAKWTQYANSRYWPLSWVYRREGRKLLEFERATVARAAHSFLVTEAEVALFFKHAPECAGRVDAVGNGVDAEFFSPAHALASPFAADERAIVFTGAMDYWPNIDAVTWFATDVLPALSERQSTVRFYIVGSRPTPMVQALAGARVVVTGTIPDVRPYLAHAAVVVAPLRVARGVQNKILEAMAMARPVVASAACAAGIEASNGVEFEVAADRHDFVTRIDALLTDLSRAHRMGKAARARVLERYCWGAKLARLDRWLNPASSFPDPTEALVANSR